MKLNTPTLGYEAVLKGWLLIDYLCITQKLVLTN